MQPRQIDLGLLAHEGMVTMNPLDIDQRPWNAVPACPGVYMRQLDYHHGVTVALIRYIPTAHTPGLAHPTASSHLWVVSGVALIDGRRMNAGSYVYVPAGVAHPIVAVGSTGCIVLQVHNAGPEAGEL